MQQPRKAQLSKNGCDVAQRHRFSTHVPRGILPIEVQHQTLSCYLNARWRKLFRSAKIDQQRLASLSLRL